MSMPRMSGRCRKAASTKAKTLTPARCVNCTKKPTSRSVEKLGEIAEWIAYDIPRDIVGEAWGGKYRGQKQKWFALRFTGPDSEIDVLSPGGGKHKPEFIDWRWVELKSLPDLVVPFKRQTYEQVVKAFQTVFAVERVPSAAASITPHALSFECRDRSLTG